MNVWIGHYKGNPSEWFLVWAETEDDAFLLMDGMEGEPDRRSMRVLNNEGLVNFSAVLAQESGETYAELEPSSLVMMEADNEHVVELLREPLDADDPDPSLEFLTAFVPGIVPSRRFTWAYGANDPDVLFLSLTPGTADDRRKPDIDIEATAEWFEDSDSDFVRHCGMFLSALEKAGVSSALGVDRLQGAVCNLSSTKIGSGESREQKAEARVALEFGLPRIRKFLQGRTRPVLLVVADPTWLDVVEDEDKRWLTLIEGKNRLTFGGIAKDHAITSYELTKEYAYPAKFTSPIVSRDIEYHIELGRFAGGAIILPGVMFSRYADKDADWAAYLDFLVNLVLPELLQEVQTWKAR